MVFIVQFIVFFVIFPIIYLFQYLDDKARKEELQRKIDKAAIQGNKEEAQFYIDRLVKMK